MALLEGAVADAQAAIERDIPLLEDAAKRAILGGVSALAAVLAGVLDEYSLTITVTLKAVKNP